MPEKPTVAAGRRRRLLKVYAVAFRILASYGWLRVTALGRQPAVRDKRLASLNRRNARLVEQTILDVQGLFIKVGQLISILSNFLPPEFRSGLESLQDQVPPRPFEEIRGRLEEELGDSLDNLFADFEEVPVAAASLAQVHAAVLPDGRRVAVKVQHRDIEELARLDLQVIRRILRIVQWTLGIRGLTDVFQQVREMIDEELDFAQEAASMETIAAAFDNNPWVGVPAVCRGLSSHRILVTDFVDGTKITDLDGLAERYHQGEEMCDRRLLAERIAGAYCQMIFGDGIYHADPHPGNLLVGRDGVLYLIDFGAVARLSPAMKRGIPEILEGVLKRDREIVLTSLQRMGFVSRQPSDDVAERVIDYFYARFLEGVELDSFNLKDIQVDARLKLEVMADLRRRDISLREMTGAFHIPREWILLQRTLVLLLGLCTHLDPEMRPTAVVRPHLEELVLGKDRDWMALVTAAAKDVALMTLSLPQDLRRVLRKADRDGIAVQTRGGRESALMFYALGQQWVAALLALGSGWFAYQAHRDGAADLVPWLLGTSAFFGLFGAAAFFNGRGWQRRLRRSLH